MIVRFTIEAFEFPHADESLSQHIELRLSWCILKAFEPLFVPSIWNENMRAITTIMFVLVATIAVQWNSTLVGQSSKKSTSLFPIKQSWGEIEFSESHLNCKVATKPENGLLTIPKFHNPLGKITCKGDSSSSGLKIKIGMKNWKVVLPKSFTSGGQVNIEVKGQPKLVGKSKIVVKPDSKTSSIHLKACAARVDGHTLRYEPQPHKNTLGYWADPDDWAEWKFEVDDAGSYQVQILQGCGKGQGGSEIEIVVGKQKLKHTVVDTGHFQNFALKKLGTIQLERGKHTLEIRAKSKAKNAVMDVRKIVLQRIKDKKLP